ncbi:autotransporter outer membrane beta-barrel domain-containing protein [Bordetella sp. H567]|uniref:autotransporter outer membrane beta-barrel domain-containing protein n=1 Tax=Bordetella sp. H567 TaxID=1697043 RepID=UPI001313ECA7|nr:autotransporter outer membrane beta-barrel domain-containing protein [Bordetella sp. H567]
MARSAAALGLLMAPLGDTRADEYAVRYTGSDRTIETTNGDAGRKTLVLGPIQTQGFLEHAVKAVEPGTSDITNADLHTMGPDAYGVYFSNASRVHITGTTITTRGDRAHGLGGFDERGDYPDWAYIDNGELRMASGTIIVEGNRSRGLYTVGRASPIHLGRPMRQGQNAAPDSFMLPGADVYIYGRGSHNTAIYALGSKNITFNGVRAILYGPSGTGILARDSTRISGENLWLQLHGADSVGMEVAGRTPCTVDASNSRCPAANTRVRIVGGALDMQGARSPAIELQRASIHLQDVPLTTSPQTSYSVGNEAGRFQFEGKDTRAILASYGSALRAWVHTADESAVFQLRHADVRSAADVLLDVVPLNGAEPLRSGRTYYAMLKLDDTHAQGEVRGMPRARAHIRLANHSIWEGHTDIGGHVDIAGDSTWAMDANSVIDSLGMSHPSTLRFVAPNRGPDAPTRFHTLTIRDSLAGRGRFEMRTHLARGRADKLDIQGTANGSYAVFITDHSGTAKTTGPRAVPIVQAHRGNASFTLANAEQAVDAGGHRYTLHKKRTATGFVWSLEREAGGDTPDTPTGGDGSPDQPDTSGTSGQAGDGDAGGGNGSGQNGNGQVDDESGNGAGNDESAHAATDDTGGGDAETPADDSEAAAIDAAGGDTAAIDANQGDIAAPGQPRRSIQAALVNNGGIASASTLWTAAMRPTEDRTQALRSGSGSADTLASGPAATGSGVWIRGIDSHQHLHQSEGGRYTQSLWGYTLGADRTVEVTAGRWHVGATATQVDAHRRFDDGKGRTSAVLFGAYAVLEADNGAYASVAASGGRFRNTVQARGPEIDGTATGRFRHSGAGIAVAGGRRLDLARGWFVEPGAGLAYFSVGAARYTLSDGTAVHDRGGHSLQSRIGIRTGRSVDLGNGGVATPYVRFNWVREFANRGAIHADGAALGTDFSGNRFEIGAGAQAQLGRRHFLYADVEVGKGRHLSQSRAIVAGYQYRW